MIFFTYNMFLPFLLSRPIPWEISIKLSRLSSSLSLPNLSLSLSLGLWQNVILFFFFTPDVISNLIEVHFCPPVLWIKMGSFYGRRCAAPWLSTLSFRLSLAWRWIVWRLCELHKLTCESRRCRWRWGCRLALREASIIQTAAQEELHRTLCWWRLGHIWGCWGRFRIHNSSKRTKQLLAATDL